MFGRPLFIPPASAKIKNLHSPLQPNEPKTLLPLLSSREISFLLYFWYLPVALVENTNEYFGTLCSFCTNDKSFPS